MRRHPNAVEVQHRARCDVDRRGGQRVVAVERDGAIRIGVGDRADRVRPGNARDIDVARAREFRASAEALLREHASGPEHERALRGLKQAETRLEVAAKNDGHMANIVP